MRKRLIAVFSLAALVLSACSGTTGSSSDNDANSAPEVPAEVLLSYELADGASYVYDVALDQNIKLVAEGSGAALSEDDFPGSADVNISGSGQFTFDIAAGPEDGTFEVTITGEVSDLTVDGVLDGEPLEGEETPDFAAIDPVSVTVLVDEKGNILPGVADLEDPFGGLLGGLEDLGGVGGGSVPGAELGQFFGPPFGDEAVTVGDSWSNSFETEGFGSDPITTTTKSEVTGTDTVSGVDVLVIDTRSTVSAFEIDLGAFFLGMFAGFLPDDASAEEQAQIDDMVENLRFVISADETTSSARTLFDPESGMTQVHEISSVAKLGFDLNFPDEDSGELSGFLMDMSIDQKLSYKLQTAEPA